MPDPVRIAIDAMGGDRGPGVIVAGAQRALDSGDVEVLLVGDPDAIRGALGGPPPDGLTVVAAGRSPVSTACDLVADGRADVVLSAGSTGEVVRTAAHRLRRVPGVLRPAIAVQLPTRPPTILLDAGAVADTDAAMLTQYAVLGSCYARAVLGLDEPTVGLLNIGSEPGKGNATVRTAFEALSTAPVRFVGNVEGGDLVHPRMDVVVTDGFTGNIALKVFEAALHVDPDAERTDVDGSAALIGLQATVLVAHGAARPTAVVSGCAMGVRLVRAGVTDRIRREIAELM